MSPLTPNLVEMVPLFSPPPLRLRASRLPGGAWWALVPALVALVLLGAASARRLGQERAALVDWYADERLDQLSQAVTDVEDGLDDVAEDLRFGADLVSQADSPADATRVLLTMLGAVAAYQRAVVIDDHGEVVVAVLDPRRRSSDDPALGAWLASAAQEAVEMGTDELVVSAPAGSGEAGWLRTFARALPATGQGLAPEGGAVALLVDTRPLVARLAQVPTPPDGRMLLLGPHGRPVPLSSVSLVEALDDPPDLSLTGLAESLALARAGERGTLRRIEEGRVLAYAPIQVLGGEPWQVVMVDTTRVLDARESAIVRRTAATAGLAGLGVLLALLAMVYQQRRDATLRGRLEQAEALARIRTEAESVLQQLPLGVAILDPSGRVSALNLTWRQRYGGAEAGSTLREALPGAGLATLDTLEAVAAEARGGSAARRVGVELEVGSQRVPSSVYALPFAEEGGRVVLAIEDLGELRDLQDQLLRAEKLSTVGALAAGIAHEVGTPLSIIRGRAEYLQKKLGADHPQAGGLSVIVEQIDRVVRTIQALLDFSRGGRAQPGPIELAPVAERLAELLRYEAERRKVRLKIQVDRGLPALAADADQLQQVLVNLLVNALDASKAGGEVRLQARRDGEAVAVSVVDQGAGIPRADLNRVFDPFFTTKKRGQGTGLGLPTVAAICRDHGATLELESEVDRGTTVHLRWPLAAKGEPDGRARSTG